MAASATTTTSYEQTLAALQAELGNIDLVDKKLAEALDDRDQLAPYRDEFIIPNNGECLYLCTNSLGLQPKRLGEDMKGVLAKWGQEGVTSWFRGEAPFATADDRVLDGLSALVGAKKHEVVAMNTLSVNIHLMLAAFYRPTAQRRKIIVEEGAFPSDMHVLRSHLALVGRQTKQPQQQPQQHEKDEEDLILIIPRRQGEATWHLSDITAFLQQHGQDTCLLFLSGLHFASGQCFDMKTITQAAHAQGMLVGFDLAHAIGNIELRLHEWDVDFACWCHYKYMCAGPGAVGGGFVNEKHTTALDPLPRLAGWWGQVQHDRFTFNEPSFQPAPGAMGFQISTPSPLLLSCLSSSLSVFTAAGGIGPIRQKSILLTGYLHLLLEQELASQVPIVTPRAVEERGCQLSLTFLTEGVLAADVLKALEARKVMADVRRPNIIRVAPFPLYTRFVDVWRFVRILKEVLRELHEQARGEEGEEEEEEEEQLQQQQQQQKEG
jgi:kynureninase